MKQDFSKSSPIGRAYVTWEERQSTKRPKRASDPPKPLTCVVEAPVHSDSQEPIDVTFDYKSVSPIDAVLHAREWRRFPPSSPSGLLRWDRSRWMTAIEQLGKAGSLDAAKQIDAIRESVDEVSVAAESYLRAIVKGLPAIPKIEQAPAWLDEPTDDYDPTTIDPRVMASARDIVRAVLAVAPAGAIAKCEPASDKGLEICWDTPLQLTWIIGKPRLPWPGVNVRAYTRAQVDRPALDVRTFFLAHRLIDHAVPVLRHGR